VKGAAMDFSFSGVKDRGSANFAPERGRRSHLSRNLAASFQEAVVDMLIRPTIAAAHAIGANTVALTGGVAANSSLHERLTQALEAENRRVVAPALRLLHRQCRDDCDGGAMSVGGDCDSLDPMPRRIFRSYSVRRTRNPPTNIRRWRPILAAPNRSFPPQGCRPSKSKGQNFLTQGTDSRTASSQPQISNFISDVTRSVRASGSDARICVARCAA